MRHPQNRTKTLVQHCSKVLELLPQKYAVFQKLVTALFAVLCIVTENQLQCHHYIAFNYNYFG